MFQHNTQPSLCDIKLRNGLITWSTAAYSKGNQFPLHQPDSRTVNF